LNQGDYCWGYSNPRAQWKTHDRCPGFENEEVYEKYRLWLKQPTTKSSHELRREVRGSRSKTRVYHLEPALPRRRHHANTL